MDAVEEVMVLISEANELVQIGRFPNMRDDDSVRVSNFRVFGD